MKEEGEVQKTLKYLKSLYNCFPFRITPGIYGSRGKSDIIVCYYGLFIAIEMKVGSNKPTDQQLRFMRDVQVKGSGLAFPCWSCDEVKELMKCISEHLNVEATSHAFQEDVIKALMESNLKAVKKEMMDMRK